METTKNHFDFKKIAVIGGGNIGTQFACTCAAKGYQVYVHSTKPEKYDGTLTIVDENGNVTCEGNVEQVTDDLAVAVTGCDVVFVTLPSFMFVDLAKKIAPYITHKTYIGVIPGTGGAEFAFRNCIDAGATLFGLQRVPCVARLQQYGKRVCVEGKREKLHLAAIPKSKAATLSAFVADLFDMPCEVLDNYLCVTMTPSNPILHTTRLCSMFADYTEGMTYMRNPLFYGEWSDASSELLFACDEEHQRLLAELKEIDLTAARSLKLHYDSQTPKQLTAKIRSIKSLHNLSSPMKQVENGWIPDFDSRYFTADFPYGLAIIKELADIAQVKVPNICATLQWYYRITGKQEHFSLKEYGIHSIQDIYDLYL